MTPGPAIPNRGADADNPPAEAASPRQPARTEPHSSAIAPDRKPRRLAMLATVTLPVVLLDQLTKSLIRENFSLDHTVALVPGWLDLTYTLNPGAAFSLFATMPPLFRHLFFIILSFAAIVVLLSLLARRATPLAAAVAYALILGGTIGNLIDRLVFGRVIDFIYFHHAWFNYPVFNLADSAITTGVVVAIVFGLFGASDPR